MAEHTSSAGRDVSVLTPRFTLRVHAEKRYRLQVALPECLVGRAEDAQLRLPHPQVAPHHCRFFWKDGRLWVQALQGEVLRDRQPLQQAPLEPGDLLQLGPVQLEILALDAPQPRPQPAPAEPPAPEAEDSFSSPGWEEVFSRRLDHLERLCRRLESEESELAEALAPLQHRLERLERRQRRLLRRLLRWQRQQHHWQRDLDQQLLHEEAQSRQVEQQVQQLQQAIDQACAGHRQVAQQMARLLEADSSRDEQAVSQVVDRIVAPLLQQVEHLERRLRELEQWTRCLRRELRGEMHSEMESRLADLRAEREALETLRQSHGTPGGAMPVTAPGVGFPLAREKAAAEETSQAEAGEAARQENPDAAPAACRQETAGTGESPPEVPCPETSLEEPPFAEGGHETSPAEAAPQSAGEEPPQGPSADAATESKPAEPLQQVSSPEPEVMAAEDTFQEENTPEGQRLLCLQPDATPARPAEPPSPEPHQETSEEQEERATPDCSLSTVELFRRLGIQVPGLEVNESSQQPTAFSPGAASPARPQDPESQQQEEQRFEEHREPAAASSGQETSLPEDEPAPGVFEEESVEDYMARLMQSIDSTSEAVPEQAEVSSPAPEAPSPEKAVEASAAAEPEEIHVPLESLEVAPGSLPASLADSPRDSAARVTPAESPETLHTLRRLANTSARTAIETYQRRLKLTATQTKLLLSVLAMLASFAMMWFAGSLPHKWAYAAAMGSLGISIYYGLRYLMLTAQNPGEKEELLEED